MRKMVWKKGIWMGFWSISSLKPIHMGGYFFTIGGCMARDPDEWIPKRNIRGTCAPSSDEQPAKHNK